MPNALAEIAPTFSSAPDAPTSGGPEAVEVAALAGLNMDPWQVHALDVMLRERNGRPAAFEAGLIVPRQNGKGSVLEALSLYWLFVEGADLVLHSAHEFKTAAEAFRRVTSLLRGCPELWAEVSRILTGAGNEAIELASGQRLRFVARSKGSGRGFSADKVILDEAYALEPEEMAALLPTLATRPAAQIVYTSSAGMATSHHLRAVRDRGRQGGDPSLAWLEWGGVAPCSPDCEHSFADPACALNDRDLWTQANPGVPCGRISLEYIEKERRALDPHVFARERLGVWDEAEMALLGLPAKPWAGCLDVASETTGRVAFGAEVSLDRSTGFVSVAGRRADGLGHLELVEARPGTAWMLDRLVELARRHSAPVAVNPASPAGSLIEPLEQRGVEVLKPTPRDIAQACGELFDDVTRQQVRHIGQQPLDDAVRVARRLPVGPAWRWDWRDPRATPLEAVTLARVAFRTLPSTAPSFRNLADYLRGGDE